MGNVVNVKREQEKKELKKLFRQIDTTTWGVNSEKENMLINFEESRDAYIKEFANKYNISSNNKKQILYTMCDVMKKRIKKVNKETYQMANAMSYLIINLGEMGERKTNKFYDDFSKIYLKQGQSEAYKYLIKNSKIWLNDIQRALINDDNITIFKNISLISVYSSEVYQILSK